MALAFTVDSIDTVPEQVRSLYKEADGKFVLDVDGYEDPTNLKSALQKEREAAKQASQQAKQWQSIGKTPEEIQQLLQAQEQAERDQLAKNGEWDKLKAQMVSQHEKQLQTLQEQVKASNATVERYLVDAAATEAIAAAKGVPALLMPHVKQSVRVVQEGGEFAVRVVDAQGQPRVNALGEFLSISDLVSEMRQSDVFGRAFEASGVTGMGMQASKPAGKAMTLTEQHLAARKR